MSELVGAAAEWLAASGPPNWVLVVALLTHPSTWSDALRERVRPLIDRLFPGAEPEGEGSK